MKLYKRKIFTRVQSLINRERVLVLQGARRVGKTSILLYLQDSLIRQGKRVVYYDLAYPGASLNLVEDLTAKGLIAEEVYVLVDNFPPSVSLDLPKNIHLIMTVSLKASFLIEAKTVEVLPLSFGDFLEFKGIDVQANERWPELYREFITYGGYPEVVAEPVVETKKQLLWQIVDIYLRKDLGDLNLVKDMAKFYRLLRVLAGRGGEILDLMALCREVDLSFPTLVKYLEVMERAFLIERVKPFSRHPGVEISRSQKLYFLDSGLQSILWLNQFQPTILDPVFKSNIFGELVKKIGRESIRFWQTKSGAEVDFIVQKKEGAILAIEAAVNFQRYNQKNFSLFKKRYNPKRWRLIGLEGEKLARNGFYPWEM